MNNSEILGEEAAVRQIISDDFSATNGVFEDDTSFTAWRHGLFRNLNTLKEIRLPNFVINNDNAQYDQYHFYSCPNLKKVVIPKVKKLNPYCFRYCNSLKEVQLDSVENIHYCFRDCPTLRFLDFPKVTAMGSEVFVASPLITTIILRSENVCTLGNINSFNNCQYGDGTIDDAFIYVPRSFINSYKTATNWSTLYARHPNVFRAIEDYTVDGTLSGEFDKTAIYTTHTPTYSISNQTFNGSSDYVDTNVNILDSTRDFAILFDFTLNAWNTTNATLFRCWDESAEKGISLHKNSNNAFFYLNINLPGMDSTQQIQITPTLGSRHILLIQRNGLKLRIAMFKKEVNASYWNNSGLNSNADAYTITADNGTTINATTTIGARNNNGIWERFIGITLHSFKLFKGFVTLDECCDNIDI